MIVWVVKADRQRCHFEFWYEAWADFKTHDSAWLYPKIMTRKRFYSMREFAGW